MPQYYADDILIAIAHYLPDRDKSLLHDRERWHLFFHERKERFSVLKDLRFRERGFYHESQELDQAYSNLVGTGMLCWMGISVSPPHFFSRECTSCFEGGVSALFSEEELGQLRQISADFYKEFSLEIAVSR